jgi:hypothetical protein
MAQQGQSRPGGGMGGMQSSYMPPQAGGMKSMPSSPMRAPAPQQQAPGGMPQPKFDRQMARQNAGQASRGPAFARPQQQGTGGVTGLAAGFGGGQPQPRPMGPDPMVMQKLQQFMGPQQMGGQQLQARPMPGGMNQVTQGMDAKGFMHGTQPNFSGFQPGRNIDPGFSMPGNGSQQQWSPMGQMPQQPQGGPLGNMFAQLQQFRPQPMQMQPQMQGLQNLMQQQPQQVRPMQQVRPQDAWMYDPSGF